MKMNNKQILALASGLALLGTGVYLLVKSGKPKNGNTPVIDPSKLLSADMDLTPYRSQINFVSEGIFDKNLNAKVKTLQTKMNSYFEKHPELEFPHYPLKVDGLLGDKTLLGIVYSFGDKMLPITDKSQIDWFNKNI
jgi:hypothetical protein